MRGPVAALVMFWSCALNAGAQPARDIPQPADRELIVNCLGNSGAPAFASDRACIGLIDHHCADAIGESYGDNPSMINCASRERVAWDSLRDEYATALHARENASQNASLDATLAEAQRWTETRCDYEASFSPGDLERITAATCLRTQAAEIALLLHWRLVERSNY